MEIKVEDLGLLPFDLMHNAHFQGGVFLFLLNLCNVLTLVSTHLPISQAPTLVTSQGKGHNFLL